MEELYTKRLLDKIVEIQEIYYLHFKPIIEEEKAEGNVGILEIVGPNGGSYKLQIKNGIVKYVDANVKTLMIIRMTEDTFLSLLAGETNLGTAFDKGRCKLIEYDTGIVDLVEMTKWRVWFSRMQWLIKKMLKI
jgi:hypothetical protein